MSGHDGDMARKPEPVNLGRIAAAWHIAGMDGEHHGAPRLFVAEGLEAGARLSLPPAQAHYLGTVMRRGAGDAVRLFNGRDGEWLARVETVGKRGLVLAVAARLRPQAPEPDLWLLFAPLKRDATELVVQKATELGAGRIVPVLTQRTNTGRVNTERLSAIAQEAAEQSERLTVPEIAAPLRLGEAVSGWPEGRPLVVAAERRDVPPVRPVPGPVALLVGPEGGFTAAELDDLARRPFVMRASLGPRILRAETAAIVGLALLQASSHG